MMVTRSRFFLILVLGCLMSCQLNEQVDRLKALKECTYTIAEVDSAYLAHTNVSSLVSRKGFNMGAAPALALAFLQREVPFRAHLLVEIKNKGTAEAGIEGFEYKVLVGHTELATGVHDTAITITPQGGTTMVRLKIQTDLYPILSQPGNQEALARFFSPDTLKTTLITLKIKPSFQIGSKKVSYPGYISIEREISNKELLSFLRNRRR